MQLTSPLKLTGQHVDLESLDQHHREALRPLAQDQTIWQHFPYTAVGDQFDGWFDKALHKMAQGEQLVFAVGCKQTQNIVGCTRYYDISPQHRKLMIGHTWYTQAARGTMINPECKLLLLTHAFEVLNFNRVELATDSRNLNSRAAIKKLGAVEEGVLRQHMILDNGYIRDTVLFAILKSDWPMVKANLQTRLGVFS